MAPWGSRSPLLVISCWTLTRLGTCGSFTLKRTVIRAMPGMLVL